MNLAITPVKPPNSLPRTGSTGRWVGGLIHYSGRIPLDERERSGTRLGAFSKDFSPEFTESSLTREDFDAYK